MNDPQVTQMTNTLPQPSTPENVNAELLELLGDLTILIRNLDAIYGNKAAGWLIARPVFQRAERLVAKLEAK